ncbi:MAG: inorganic phosphate transporter [Methylococcaceae bacterium]
MILLLLIIAVCFLSFANGANDNFKGVASLYGSGAASYRMALFWATLTTLAGSLSALYLAQTLVIKFSGKGLVADALIQSVPFITAVAAGAGLTVILATRLGFPVSTTHALLGAMAGSGVLATWGEMNLTALQNNFVLPLLLSPLVAMLLATVIYLTLKQVRQRMNIGQSICLCLENEAAMNAEIGFAAMTQNLQSVITIDNEEACNSRYSGKVLGINAQSAVDKLHFLSAGSVCFARGLNDTPKIAALLLLVPSLTMHWIIVLVAVIMALGGLINARRVAETMSHKITEISHGQGLVANMTTALLVIFASQFGMPVSTTHVSVGSLFGIGLANGKAHHRMIGIIVLSWLLTLPCAALCAATIYLLADMFG